jgi:alpha-L-arabinofuranosidase
VNVIAPIMTETGGSAWRQTIYWPYYFASRFGRGTALNLAVTCPGYDADVADNVPWLDVAGVHDEVGSVLTFFAVNRHGTETLRTSINLLGFGEGTVLDHQIMAQVNLHAVNTDAQPSDVVPASGSGASLKGGTLTIGLAPLSYHMIRVSLGARAGSGKS